MSKAYFHKGLTFEFDISGPLTIEGQKISYKKDGNWFVLDEQSIACQDIRATSRLEFAHAVIECPELFEKRKKIRDEHISLLDGTIEAWNAWRIENPHIRPILFGANLNGRDLCGGINFSYTDLCEAQLEGAQLAGANFHQANLAHANLEGANLEGANFCRADLYETDFSQAMLKGANLQGVQMARTDFSGATLIDCHLYGMSAWDLILDGTTQRDLLIRYMLFSHEGKNPEWVEDHVTVDDLKTAQFIYLLLCNKNIRNVVDGATSKTVLILGRFTQEKLALLNKIREELRRQDFVPMLYNFATPENRGNTGTIEILARLSKFIIADISDPLSVPHELGVLVQHMRRTPILPLLEKGAATYSMFDDFRAYPWVMAVHEYTDDDSFMPDLISKIEQAGQKVNELRVQSRRD